MDENFPLDDDIIEELINQTINGAISTIPDHISEVQKNNELFKVKDPKEFVYGLVIGMALGMGGAMITAQKGIPSEEDQMKIRDMIFKNIPSIREQIFK
jgi:hypothetical protein